MPQPLPCAPTFTSPHWAARPSPAPAPSWPTGPSTHSQHSLRVRFYWHPEAFTWACWWAEPGLGALSQGLGQQACGWSRDLERRASPADPWRTQGQADVAKPQKRQWPGYEDLGCLGLSGELQGQQVGQHTRAARARGCCGSPKRRLAGQALEATGRTDSRRGSGPQWPWLEVVQGSSEGLSLTGVGPSHGAAPITTSSSNALTQACFVFLAYLGLLRLQLGPQPRIFPTSTAHCCLWTHPWSQSPTSDCQEPLQWVQPTKPQL